MREGGGGAGWCGGGEGWIPEEGEWVEELTEAIWYRTSPAGDQEGEESSPSQQCAVLRMVLQGMGVCDRRWSTAPSHAI